MTRCWTTARACMGAGHAPRRRLQGVAGGACACACTVCAWGRGLRGIQWGHRQLPGALWHVCDPRRLRSLYLSTIPGGIAALPASIQIASAMVPPCAPCEVGEVSEVRAGGGCARGHAGWLRKEEVPTRERGAGDRPTSSTTRHCGSAEPVTSTAVRLAILDIDSLPSCLACRSPAG